VVVLTAGECKALCDCLPVQGQNTPSPVYSVFRVNHFSLLLYVTPRYRTLAVVTVLLKNLIHPARLIFWALNVSK